jgi:hypothetical protein
LGWGDICKIEDLQGSVSKTLPVNKYLTRMFPFDKIIDFFKGILQNPSEHEQFNT